jgi:hypothetical protein
MKNLIAAVSAALAVAAACAAGLAYAQSGGGESSRESARIGRYQMGGDGWRLDTVTGAVWRCDVRSGRCVKYAVE